MELAKRYGFLIVEDAPCRLLRCCGNSILPTAFFPSRGGERFLRLPCCGLGPAEVDDGTHRLAEPVREVAAG